MAGAERARGAGLILVAMTVANAMILIDQTAVPVSLPAIMDGFHVGSADVQWVLNCSLLPLAGLLVLGGRLGDLLGPAAHLRRRARPCSPARRPSAGSRPSSRCCSPPGSPRASAVR